VRVRRMDGWLAGALAAALMAPGAAAQETTTLNLLCRGTDAVPVIMAPNAWNNGRYGTMGGVVQGRELAQLGVAVEGGKVRVKPPKSAIPLFAKDDQGGWYELSDVAIDRLSINGRLKWNRLDRSKLEIDRRTGAATFGAFSGVCQVVSTDPEATKF
jgi:hypothetical protein